MKLRVVCGAVLTVMCTAKVDAQDFEAFSASEEKAFGNYVATERESFAQWKKEQERIYDQWQEDVRRYRSTSLRNIAIDKANDSGVVKSDVDFSSEKIGIAAVTYAGDSLRAAAHARMLVKKNIALAIERNMPEESRNIPAEKMKTYIDRAASEAEVVVEKQNAGYVAKASAGAAMTGNGSLMALMTPESKSNDVVSLKKSESPPGSVVYTSVIIDARNVGYTACLIPLLITMDGKELYGPRVVKKEYAINGMAQWAGDSVSAMKSPIVGKTPLFLSADKVVGKRRLLFEEKKARQLERVAMQSDALEKCRIVIMVK